jgi:hypothetical protein
LRTTTVASSTTPTPFPSHFRSRKFWVPNS